MIMKTHDINQNPPYNLLEIVFIFAEGPSFENFTLVVHIGFSLNCRTQTGRPYRTTEGLIF